MGKIALLSPTMDHAAHRELPMGPALMPIRGTRARDPIVPQRWAEEVAALLPRGRLVVPDAAHSMNFTAPERFAGVLTGAKPL